jgi:branched-chain amino acid transport system ATP-binding protein
MTFPPSDAGRDRPAAGPLGPGEPLGPGGPPGGDGAKGSQGPADGDGGGGAADGAAGTGGGAGGSAGPPPILAVDGVVAGYGGGDVLRGVSFTVAPGGITCVVGPNGAGKSTLLAAISGLLRPRLGTITLRGEIISGKTPRQILALGVVHVPQRRSLFPDMTVRENVELGAFMVKEKAVVARRLAAVEEMFPIVAEFAGKKAASLSGGQQRLVEFARCLMLDPTLIILDEPSMGLAPRVLRSVFDAVRMMNGKGKTILLVEQNARAGLRLSTHGVVLENGTVRLSGSGRDVLENPEIGALYLGGAVSGAGSP